MKTKTLQDQISAPAIAVLQQAQAGLAEAIALRVATLEADEQNATIAALEDRTRRRAEVDRVTQEYVVWLDGGEFLRVPISELLAQ
jgi:hypothetical protein